MQFNQHLAYPGDVVFQHACKMGLEGIVSAGLALHLRPDWLKVKNANAPAVKREAEVHRSGIGGCGGIYLVALLTRRDLLFRAKDLLNEAIVSQP